MRTPREVTATVTNAAEREVIMRPNQKFKVLRIRQLDDYPSLPTEGGGHPILVDLEAIP